MNINIITNSFYDFNNNEIKIGGLETYIQDLANLASSLNFSVNIFQFTNEYGQKTIQKDNYTIISGCLTRTILKSSNQRTFDTIYQKYNADSKFIIATDQLDIKSHANNVICIQHGIAFDIPGYMIKGLWGKSHSLQLINKTLRCLKNVYRFYNTKHTVCVDYNYYNWFRTIGTIYKGMTLDIIPNHTSLFISKVELNKKLSKTSERKHILFARRFVDYRGTLLFANAIKSILQSRTDVEFTFAGNGPLESEIKNMFSTEKRVHFSQFKAKDSVEFHKRFDIAIVPTIFSEGTSLSLCEAMAAGCLPIATHVGGMTNMILNHFNGFLVSPNEAALIEVINSALNLQPHEFKDIVINAYNSSLLSFSKERWLNDWKKILSSI